MSFWRRALALMALLVWSLRGMGRTLLFMLQRPRDARWAIATTAGIDPEAPPTSTLEQVGPSLYRLASARPAPERDAHPRPPVVLYFTGTGETPEAVLSGFQRLRVQVPALAEAREYVIAPPTNKGAYYGANQFSARMWEVVEPLVKHDPGPFVLVGFSRGALVALDLTTRIVEEHAKVACALALSAPIVIPLELPAPVTAVAGFEPVLEGIRAACEGLPPHVVRHAERRVWACQLLLTAMILKDLGVESAEELRFAVNDMHTRGTFESSLSAAREFRLLLEAQPREGDLFSEGLVRVFAEARASYAELLWGSTDDWVQAGACRARMAELLAQYPKAAERVRIEEIPNQGHALFRASAASPEPVLRALQRVSDEAVRRAAERESAARRQADQSAIQRPSANEEMS